MKQAEIIKQFILNGESKGCSEYLEELYTQIECREYAEAYIRVLLIETVKDLNDSVSGFYYIEEELAKEIFSRDFLDIKVFVNEICRRLKSAAEENRQARFEKIKSYIHKNYTDAQFSLSAAARYVNLSQANATKLFVAKEGITPGEYIGRLRVKKGIDFLCKGATVMEASAMVGFSSSEAYIRAFKKYMGTTPGLWKRNKLLL